MENLFWEYPTIKEKQPEEMTEKELQLKLYNKVMEIHDFMAVLKHNYDKIVSTIEVDTRTLMALTGMSMRTLCRWRSARKIRYYVRQDGYIYYKFEELYVDVKSGRLDGKCFNRLETLARMKAYYYGVMKKNNNIVEWDAEEYDFPS